MIPLKIGTKKYHLLFSKSLYHVWITNTVVLKYSMFRIIYFDPLESFLQQRVLQ